EVEPERRHAPDDVVEREREPGNRSIVPEEVGREHPPQFGLPEPTVGRVVDEESGIVPTDEGGPEDRDIYRRGGQAYGCRNCPDWNEGSRAPHRATLQPGRGIRKLRVDPPEPARSGNGTVRPMLTRRTLRL